MEPLFLGLDSSTQALKASLLTSELAVLSELEVRFDADLPHFNTVGGVLHGPEGSGEVFSPVMQPIEALDMLCEKMVAAGWELSSIRGVSAAGQQHASVYWSKAAPALLSSLNSEKTLASQLTGAFSRDIIPNWQDSSTTKECEALTRGAGGASELARITGSGAHTRFTGAQIMRFRSSFPDQYAATQSISLVSSFMTTLLCADGEVKGIDESDACGMNMWDMGSAKRGWNRAILSIIAGEGGEDDLAAKLGTVETDGGRVVGHIGTWFQKRYGFHPDCAVFPGTGDNPATFLSLVLRESEGLVSLGTSDVVLVSTAQYNPHPEFHAFFHPAMIAPPSIQNESAGTQLTQHEELRYFNMLVFKNGSLAREHVRDKYFDKSWDKFDGALQKLRPRSRDDVPQQTAFWWLLPDIIPAGAKGVFKYIGHPASSASQVDSFPDVDTEALAILESQMLNYRTRSGAILSDPANPSATLSRVYATGGAAKNPTICSIMADVLGCPVSKNVDWDSETESWVDAKSNDCSVGVAYKARWGYERAKGRNVAFDDLMAEIKTKRLQSLPAAAWGEVYNVAVPGPGAPAYVAAAPWWTELEARALAESRKA